ncbi:MAG TPA: nucleotidyltransferase family protein, partial [Gemmatimonadaceae bacterium]
MSLDVLSSEAQLLLLAAGGARNDARIRELVAGEIDWAKLGWIASRERAAPVLWERLHAVPGIRLPEDAAPLRKLAMVSDFRMRHLETRLDDSLAALEGAKVDALLLKGAALAVLVYGSFSRRPMSDVDILVRRGEASRALPALLAAGWTSVD